MGWDVPSPPTRSALESYFMDGRPSITTIYRLTQTDRMVIQQSFFTACRDVLKNHEDVLSGYDDILSKYVIPASLKTISLSRLKMMNISAATLFPCIDGIGRSIDEFIRFTAR
jgi:hypothetical protein